MPSLYPLVDEHALLRSGMLWGAAVSAGGGRGY